MLVAARLPPLLKLLRSAGEESRALHRRSPTRVLARHEESVFEALVVLRVFMWSRSAAALSPLAVDTYVITDHGGERTGSTAAEKAGLLRWTVVASNRALQAYRVVPLFETTKTSALRRSHAGAVRRRTIACIWTRGHFQEIILGLLRQQPGRRLLGRSHVTDQSRLADACRDAGIEYGSPRRAAGRAWSGARTARFCRSRRAASTSDRFTTGRSVSVRTRAAARSRI